MNRLWKQGYSHSPPPARQLFQRWKVALDRATIAYYYGGTIVNTTYGIDTKTVCLPIFTNNIWSYHYVWSPVITGTLYDVLPLACRGERGQPRGSAAPNVLPEVCVYEPWACLSVRIRLLSWGWMSLYALLSRSQHRVLGTLFMIYDLLRLGQGVMREPSRRPPVDHLVYRCLRRGAGDAKAKTY